MENHNDSVGIDVILEEDGEKGPHCAHGSSENVRMGP